MERGSVTKRTLIAMEMTGQIFWVRVSGDGPSFEVWGFFLLLVLRCPIQSLLVLLLNLQSRRLRKS